MTAPTDYKHWTGAYAVTKLVGRQAALDQIASAIEAAGDAPQLISVTGEGGIGKTRLLRGALEFLSDIAQGYRVATNLVDVYDLESHSIVGLTERIVPLLQPGEAEFVNYWRQHRELAGSEATGVREEQDLHQAMARAFIGDIAAVAAQQRVVIAIDTAERLSYASQVNEPSDTIAKAWSWLAAAMPTIRNVTWLVAGRASATQELLSLVSTGVARSNVELGQLDEQASIDYFDSAAEVARDHGDTRAAERLASLPTDFRRKAYAYAHGRPLLLALLADLLLVQNLPAAQQLIDGQAPGHRTDAATEQALISRLLETPGMGPFLLAAGRLRKGFDQALMFEALKVFHPHVTAGEVEQQFQQFRKLSFVKERAGRLFLHDVMYEMLDAQVYRKESDRPEAGDFYGAMIAYNTRQAEALTSDTEQAYRPVEVERNPEELNRDMLVELNRRRHALVTERLYYLLRSEAVRGFRHYFRATFDAVLASDITLDIELEAELLAFLNERDPQQQAEFVDGLERAVCEAVARLRPVARSFAAGQHTQAITTAEELRKNGHVLALGGPGTDAILGIWEAYARIYRAEPGDMDRAKALLDSAVHVLSEIIHENNQQYPSRVWRAQGGLAFGYMVRGYLHWSRGELEEATDDYTASVQLGQAVRVNVNLATAENDLGFVRAEAGDIGDARKLVERALGRRRKLGPRAQAAFSINTLALIDTRAGAYDRAIERSDLARTIFGALGHRRGETLALIALAEAKRRHATDGPRLAFKRRARLLDEAKQHASAALKLAEDLDERLRQIEALIELGCAARDRLRIQENQSTPLSAPQVAKLVEQSKTALEQAAALADTQFLYRYVDALVNIAYLGFYAKDDAQAQAAIERAEQAFPPGYWLAPATGAPSISRDQANVQIWTQLGKLHTLRGHIAFERYGPNNDEEALRQAINSYLLSLKYNSLYSPEHPGMTAMRNQAKQRLKSVPRDSLHRVAGYVSEAMRQQGVQDTALRQMVRQLQWDEQ